MTRVVVTGAAGFIGSNLVAGLNAKGIDDVIAVDDLTDGQKYRNLVDLRISDYVDADTFYERFANGDFGKVDAVFHEGACSDTMEQNGKYMLFNNYTRSSQLLDACQQQGARLLYASSAATYGGSAAFVEKPEFELPLNVYGYSKLLFDQRVRQLGGNGLSKFGSQVTGFRYFNVYGPREGHKGRMASVAFHQFHQFRAQGKVRLFGGHEGWKAGEQSRDFVSVADVVAVNLWFMEHPDKSGIFNLGTGRAQPFNDVAVAVVNTLRKTLDQEAAVSQEELLSRGFIEYIEFPDALKGKYQSYTCADLANLRSTGCNHEFSTVGAGVEQYMLDLCAAEGLLDRT